MEISGKTALVTGGAGFIGSTLVRKLLDENVKVIVYDNFFSGDPENLREVADKIEVIRGDILDPAFDKVLEKNGVKLVFNLAAEPFIPSCYDRPEHFFEVNATGTMNVLIACRDAGVERAVQYSSSEVYGTAKTVPMTEDHPTLPLSTYAVSKLAADRLAYTLHHEQKIGVVILRQFNVYGPRETHPYIIPELITQLNKGKDLKLGNIKASRDLTYVDDAALGAIALMKCDKAVGEVVNMGYGEDTTVEELARTIGKLMGHDDVNIEVEQKRLRPLDVEQLVCDHSKLTELTGWEPKVGLEEGLKSTIDFFRKSGNKWLWEEKLAKENNVWDKK